MNSLISTKSKRKGNWKLPLPSDFAPRKSEKAKAIFLILLLLSSGISAPAATAIQRNQFNNALIQFNFSPQAQSSRPDVGFFFFSSFGGQGGTTGDPLTSAVGQTLSTLSQIPSTTSGVNYFYYRQGNAYYVFPENNIENGGNPVSLVLFGPLLTVWLDSEKRRSRFRIYVEILDLLKKGPMTPYEVSFHLRLNSKRTREFMEFLEEKDLLQCSDQDGRLICRITPSGGIFVQNVSMILGESE